MSERAENVRFVEWGAMGSCTASPKSRVVPGREMGTSGLDSVQAEVMSLASYLAAPPRGRVMSGVYLSVPPSPCQGEAAAQNPRADERRDDEPTGAVVRITLSGRRCAPRQARGGTMCLP